MVTLTRPDGTRPEDLHLSRRGLTLALTAVLAYVSLRLAGARGHFTIAGTPEQIADLIQDWFTDGAADGFNIMPPLLPAMLDVFSAEVIPLLQRRGLFRTSYEGKTLREHYGLAWPKSAFDEAVPRPFSQFAASAGI